MHTTWPDQFIDLNLDRLEAMLSREHYDDFFNNLATVRSDTAIGQEQIDYSYLLEAQYFFTKRAYSETINILTPLYKKYPHNVRVYSMLFRALYGEHRYDDAVSLTVPSTENSYDLADIYLCQAMNHRINNDFQKTKQLCEQAILTNPQFNDALEFYITQIQTPQDALRALELSKSMIDENPHNVAVRWTRVLLFETLQLDDDLKSEALILSHISGNNAQVSQLLQKVLPL